MSAMTIPHPTVDTGPALLRLVDSKAASEPSITPETAWMLQDASSNPAARHSNVLAPLILIVAPDRGPGVACGRNGGCVLLAESHSRSHVQVDADCCCCYEME